MHHSSFIRLWHKGDFVTIYGDEFKGPKEAQFHHIKRMMYIDSLAETFTIKLRHKNTKEESNLPLCINQFLYSQQMEPELAILLHTYATIFEVPLRLPQKRIHDHCIPLVVGAQPVKARPYRYPHFQKEQIEVMMQQILEEGIIQPSKSHFSFPILLVKRKMGWRFCTDYIALNKITIKNITFYS